MTGNNTPPSPQEPTVPTVREAAITVLDDLRALMGQSEGVAGLHLNGDLAPWSEIVRGGRFEEWLGSIETLRLALQNERTTPPPIDHPELARQGIDLIRAGADVTAEHIVAVVEAAETAFDAARSFGIRWDADMRAIKRWAAGDRLAAGTRRVLESTAKLLRDDERKLREDAWRADTSNGGKRPTEAEAAMMIGQAERFGAKAAEIEEELRLDELGGKELLWPDHADLVVWLLELIEARPACPSVDQVAAQIRSMRYAYSASPIVLEAADMLEQLANSLIAASRRVMQAESDRRIIPPMIASWIRSEADGYHQPTRNDLGRVAAQVEAGEWLPLRGAAIRAAREAGVALPLQPGEQGNGCDQIDTADIPEASAEWFERAEVRRLRPVPNRVERCYREPSAEGQECGRKPDAAGAIAPEECRFCGTDGWGDDHDADCPANPLRVDWSKPVETDEKSPWNDRVEVLEIAEDVGTLVRLPGGVVGRFAGNGSPIDNDDHPRLRNARLAGSYHGQPVPGVYSPDQGRVTECQFMDDDQVPCGEPAVVLEYGERRCGKHAEADGGDHPPVEDQRLRRYGPGALQPGDGIEAASGEALPHTANEDTPD